MKLLKEHTTKIKLKNSTKKRAACIALTALACTCLALARPYLVNKFAPETIATAAAKKQLPIYCVDTGTSKKIAISFDAAWGAGRLRRSYVLPFFAE
jgi:hypothetical protein